MEYKERETFARCLECGDEISYGRTDKKFCCEECKNTYHNRKSMSERIIKSRVNGIITNNYKILNSIVQSGIESIGLIDLMNMGFIPGFVTYCIKTRGHMEMCCYDIHFYMGEHKIFSITRIENISLNLHDKNKKYNEKSTSD